MYTNSETHYKGFTYQPVIKVSKEIVDETDGWYEYLIEGRRGKRKVLVKGSGVYKTPESASRAAKSFAKSQIDAHLYRYQKSILYRIICNFGYCPASKFK